MSEHRIKNYILPQLLFAPLPQPISYDKDISAQVINEPFVKMDIKKEPNGYPQECDLVYSNKKNKIQPQISKCYKLKKNKSDNQDESLLSNSNENFEENINNNKLDGGEYIPIENETNYIILYQNSKNRNLKCILILVLILLLSLILIMLLLK
jgi:hypothetical protein